MRGFKIDELNLHFDLFKMIAERDIPDYSLNEKQTKIAKMLIAYFNGHESVEKRGVSLSKGIYLYGDFGTGKTTLFRILRTYLTMLHGRHPNGYRQTSVEEIINDYKKSENFDNYLKPSHLLINEFATENDYKLQIYGSRVSELIKSFLMLRYENFSVKGGLVHTTSNLDYNELKTYYEPKLTSRFFEMFNFIEFTGKSKR
jgi:predicted ATPase